MNLIEITKTTSVLDKIKEHYLRSKDKANVVFPKK